MTNDSGVKETVGLKAGGLDAGSILGQSGSIQRDCTMTFAPFLRNNWSVPAIIESVTPVSASAKLKASKARIWITHPLGGKGFYYYLPIGAHGWPPRLVYARKIIAKLRSRNVVVPPHGLVQLPFHMRSLAPIGTKVRIVGMKVVFKQRGRRYEWTFPIRIVFRTAGPKPGHPGCPEGF
jgi:hypothetical protein